MFTIQQIQEIARRLSSMSKKDSDFKPLDTWKSLNKQDYIAFVKDGINRVVSIDQLHTYIRQNINSDIGNALERIDALETVVQKLSTTLNVFMKDTNADISSLYRNIRNINRTLDKLTAKYTIIVMPVTPNATVFINGARKSLMRVTHDSIVHVKVSAEGYDTYEEFIPVEDDITLRPELNPSKVTFTINVNPLDSTVAINNVARKSITVAKRTLVYWRVFKDGYVTQTGSETIETSSTLPVILAPLESDKFNFTVVAFPPHATITINGVQTNHMVVEKGSRVTWSVEAPHYEYASGVETITGDIVVHRILSPEQVVLTINPTPADANVELNGVSQKSIMVDYNKSVHIKVSKDGYKTHEENYTVTSTETKNITLSQIVETSWTDLVLTKADTSENPINSVPKSGGKVSFKANVTAHFNNGVTTVKDVTSQVQWSVIGEGCTSNGEGVFTWAENTSTSARRATVVANVIGPDSKSLSKSIQTIQQRGDGILKIEPSSLTFESTGGTQTFNITSNDSWTLS